MEKIFLLTTTKVNLAAAFEEARKRHLRQLNLWLSVACCGTKHIEKPRHRQHFMQSAGVTCLLLYYNLFQLWSLKNFLAWVDFSFFFPTAFMFVYLFLYFALLCALLTIYIITHSHLVTYLSGGKNTCLKWPRRRNVSTNFNISNSEWWRRRRVTRKQTIAPPVSTITLMGLGPTAVAPTGILTIICAAQW